MTNISQNGLSRDNPHFVCIYKNLFYLGVIRLLSNSSLVLFGIKDLILYTNSYFNTECNEP